MLTGIHFLLTYTCNFECDHCFLFCGPRAAGTFTLKQVEKVLDEATKIKTVKWIYFEGGEPFLYYPLMCESIRCARTKGFETGIVTNAYWATSPEDAAIWLKPLRDLGVSDFSISDDAFHYGEQHDNPAKNALEAARMLEMAASVICIEKPTVEKHDDLAGSKGRPVIGGGARFRGRAVEKLTQGLPRSRWDSFTECPDEDLKNPDRVHIDAFGNVHICQGLIIGSFLKTPLSEIINNYDPGRHPICGPLIEGGPAALVKKYGTRHENDYVDECHLCYLTRLQLLARFPDCLGPRQAYSLSDDG
jgi:MoaA/NifB/PqqE/SkfB family radical SAM enzyme